MSGGTIAGKTWTGRVADALSLSLVFAILYFATRAAPGLRGDASVLGALGFLLLAGTLMSELVEVLGLPHLTGYLLAGIIAGPHVLVLVDLPTVKRLAPVNTLALAIIALAGGAELHFDQVKKGLKSLTIATVIQSVAVTTGIAGVFVVARDLVPFTKEMTDRKSVV